VPEQQSQAPDDNTTIASNANTADVGGNASPTAGAESRAETTTSTDTDTRGLYGEQQSTGF
jgi:hypothetical protein